MNAVYLGLAELLLLTTSAGFVRMWCAPAAGERGQARRLLGTSGVAMVLLLAQAARGLRDMVLLFSLLGGVTMVAFILLTWSDPVGSGQLDSEEALIESREAERLLCCRRLLHCRELAAPALKRMLFWPIVFSVGMFCSAWLPSKVSVALA